MKQTSLIKVFYKYLFSTITGSVFIFAAIAVGLVFAMYRTGIILPANRIEDEISDWTKEFNMSETTAIENIPTGAGYAVFTSDGELVKTNFPDKVIKQAESAFLSDYSDFQILDGTIITVKKTGKEYVVVFSYSMISSFANKTLSQYLPNPETCMLILGLIMAILFVVLNTIRTVKIMKRELIILSDTVTAYMDHDLSYVPKESCISEYNDVLTALVMMKDALSDALKKMWQDEQNKRTQMAQIIHEINTPLTIIRGNAELLAEGENANIEDMESAVDDIQKKIDSTIELSNTRIMSTNVI